jgi:hypothetical protein
VSYFSTGSKSLTLVCAMLIGAISAAVATPRHFGVWKEDETWSALDDEPHEPEFFMTLTEGQSFLSNGVAGSLIIYCSNNRYRFHILGPFPVNATYEDYHVGPVDVQVEFSPGKYVVDFHTQWDGHGGFDIPLNAKQVEGLHYEWTSINVQAKNRPFLWLPTEGISKAMEALDDDCSGRAKSRPLPVRPFG